MIVLIYLLGVTLILSCFFGLRVKEVERRFSFGLIRTLVLLPLLGCMYLYVSFNLTLQQTSLLSFSENVFSLIWLFTANKLYDIASRKVERSNLSYLYFAMGGTAVVVIGGYWLHRPPAAEIIDNFIVIPRYGQLYLSALFLLIVVFFMAWRLEIFWRALAQKERWQYKFVVIGFFLICGSLFWCASYRILYRRLDGNQLLLLAILLFLATLLILFAVIRHRLLNRTLFVSRKVIYSVVAPITFGGYLILLGVASLLMRAYGWSLPYVLQWLLIVVGLLSISVLVFSGRVRSFLKHFISTHFYVNKYEYRDEWLAFSNLLQGTLTEREVADALHRILSKSLYTRDIVIWLGNIQEGFQLVIDENEHRIKTDEVLSINDPLVQYLNHEQYLYLKVPGKTQTRQKVIAEKKDFFIRSGLVLFVPLNIGGQCVGIIGLGPEYIEGRYGPDDFDLLTALGSQAASAILAARSAERLAQTRENFAWDTLSAFVLHDIKNATTMLNLVKENAPAHIHKPEFQKDLLVSVNDALRRMNKVQEGLTSLKGEITPIIKSLDICQFVRGYCRNLSKKLPDLAIDVHCRQNLTIQADSEMIAQIIENLMINALESGGPGTRVHINVSNDDHHIVQLEIVDNGPGIPKELLPDRLFRPFITNKPNGNGIGLWQINRLLKLLGGTIDATNVETGGAKFVIRLPAN